MRIHTIRTLNGPNVYHHRPVLRMTLDLEALYDTPSRALPGFTERLLAMLPGLQQHHCSRRHVGGFVERLHQGTYLGHIVEHVALELSEPVGIGVTYGKTLGTDDPHVYEVMVRFRSEAGMRFLLETAVALVTAVIAGESFPLAEQLQEARRIVERSELGPSSNAILAAAERRHIPWQRVADNSLVQLGYGKQRRLLQTALSGQTSHIAVEIAQDKALTKTLLRQAAIPVPQGIIVTTAEEAVAALTTLGAPVVVKPLNGHQGKGVSLYLNTSSEVEFAFTAAQVYSTRILVEEQFTGSDYRVVVVNNTVVAASQRLPAHVIGDGTHTIATLITQENANSQRGEGHVYPLSRILIDPVLMACLQRQGLHLESIPEKAQMVWLRDCANLSTGGTAIDVTDQLHPDTRWLCERAARAIGLDICGIDLVVPDIAAPVPPHSGVIEVNAAPGLRMHHFPSVGQPRDVGDAIIEMLYPPGTSARIPIIAITGTNGKTTVTRMIGHTLSAVGQTVGMTTTDGIVIDGRCIKHTDASGPQSARMVLADPTVDVAVLETARGGIVRRGLGYDWADIAILTNIHADHIGQDGIRSVEDLVHIKSLVAERVRPGGTLILNAENPPVAALAAAPRVQAHAKRLVYFALDSHHPMLQQHLLSGGTGYTIEKDWIVEVNGGHVQPMVEVATIPATLQGLVDFHTANAMAAVAACRAHGLAPRLIAAALQTFTGAAHNAGRLNLYHVRDGYVIVDYGHNAHAFAALGRMTQRLAGYRLTGVLDVPGDRADWVIEQAGRVAARMFHRVLLWQSNDLRGRQSGAVARMLRRAMRRENPHCQCRMIPNHQEAMATALRDIKAGDLVYLFYDNMAPVQEVLTHFAATPATHLPLRRDEFRLRSSILQPEARAVHVAA